MEKEVEAVVDVIEELDSEIASLQQQRRKLTSDNFEELLEHDLGTIKNVESVLSNLTTAIATGTIEEYDVLGTIEEVISDIEGFLFSAKEGKSEYEIAKKEGRTVSSYLHE